ncbi:DUF3558 family protein [Nocardia sp. R7R-8]|uniref:DUF3558 family protein n=1 Tax=Nocardia sp. R7R-8 TaxID=3459304 RepID=UPI00403DC34A
MSRRITLVLLGSLAASGVVGCGDTTSGLPTSSTAAAKVLFDPCTGVPDDVLRAAGVDPATAETGIGGVHQSGWAICAWKGSRYSISIYSTSGPPAEIADKPGNTGQRGPTIAGRTGTEFRSAGWVSLVRITPTRPQSLRSSNRCNQV